MANNANKWKVPSWMKPGTRAVVARGKKYTPGTTGTILSTETTGNGAYVWFEPDTNPKKTEGDWNFPDKWHVPVLNVDPI